MGRRNNKMVDVTQKLSTWRVSPILLVTTRPDYFRIGDDPTGISKAGPRPAWKRTSASMR